MHALADEVKKQLVPNFFEDIYYDSFSRIGVRLEIQMKEKFEREFHD